VQAIFYNDPQPDKIFYQGLAWLRLGEQDKAEAIFNRLIRFAAEHMNDEIKIDYFAVSLPDLLVFDQDLNRKNKIHCHYLTGLGLLGLGDELGAEAAFKKALAEDHNHQGAITHLNMIPFLSRHGY
jgi:tetratricopeptide (TPR) repeat protein